MISVLHINFRMSEPIFIKFVRFEVFTAVTIKNAIIVDVALCGSCKNRHFGGMSH
jgi:hypothetical protein